MTIASLIHTRCGYSPRIANRNNGFKGSIASSSNPTSSSLPWCSSSSLSNSGLGFASVTNSGNRHQDLRAEAMSSTTGNSITRNSGSLKSEPDHLLVLVHGTLASPRDWIFAVAKLKRHLGKNFLISASSSNTYTKTFGGVDGAGKRPADGWRLS